MREKVILSRDYTETFLAMAFQEGLLKADKNKNDHIYEKYKETQIDFDSAKSILEQLLLSPIPLIRKRLHESVEGSLIEENQIIFDDRKVEIIVPMNRYPTDLFLGILKGNGIEMTEREFKDIIDAIVQADKEYDQLELEFEGKMAEVRWGQTSNK